MADSKTNETPEAMGLPKSLFLHNLSYHPEHRSARRQRPGNRTTFMLGDGTRVRRKNNRPTEVAIGAVIEHIDQILDGVKHKYIRVTADGDGTQDIPVEALESLKGTRFQSFARDVPEEELSERVKKEAKEAAQEGATDVAPPELRGEGETKPPEIPPPVGGEMTQVIVPAVPDVGTPEEIVASDDHTHRPAITPPPKPDDTKTTHHHLNQVSKKSKK